MQNLTDNKNIVTKNTAIIIKNAAIITGDGSTVIEKGNIFIDNGRIVDITQGDISGINFQNTGTIIDGSRCYAIPGVINAHAHGCTVGPLFPSGAKPLSLERARRNAGRMLMQGVTTLVNVCGFCLPEDLDPVTSSTPMNIRLGTCHLPVALQSADMVDGSGLELRHKSMTAKEMLEKGAVVIGEMGSGASLGGGVTDYKYIPEAVERETGVRITASQANSLKTAVLGKTLEVKNFNETALKKAADEAGIAGKIDLQKLRETIEDVALKPVAVSLQSFEEACELSAETGVPAVFHNSLVSAPKILELAKKYHGTKAKIVAGHSNHPSFTPEEAVHYAVEMKKYGAIIDISTLDGIITHWMNGTTQIDALVKEGLVDTISTDYGGSHWDGGLEGVHHLVKSGLVSIAEGVAMATGNVAKIHPLAAPDRGFIEKGKIADIVITDDKNVGRVDMVIIGGRIAAGR